MDYLQKYLKYKNKYLNLKIKAGVLKRDDRTLPPFKYPSSYDNTNEGYNEILKEIEKINTLNPTNSIFVLKIGSNDLTTGARCESNKCVHYLYNNTKKF